MTPDADVAGGVCDALFVLTLAHEYSPRRYSLDGGGDEVLRLPVTSALVQTQAGPFLLDTGLNPALFRRAAEAAAIYPFGDPEFPTEGDPLLDALARCGVGPGDLAGVAMSHLHIDHAGGLRHLVGGPPVYVARRELDFGLGRAGPAEAYWRPDYDLPGLDWRPFDGDTTLAPGLDALATPGHTPGHLSFRVRLRETGTWLLAMDAIDLQEGIDRDVPVGWSADPADGPARRSSHDRLVALAAAEGARLVPGHCPVTWPRLKAPPAYYR